MIWQILMKLLECGEKGKGGMFFLKSSCPYLFPGQYHFVLPSKVHINHSIGLNCPVKIKMIPNCSRITQGLFSVQYVREAKTDAQEEEDYNQ